MRLTEEQRQRVRNLLTSDSSSFRALSHLAGLDPATDFLGANLRNIDFGAEPLVGFDFSSADLRFARIAGDVTGVSFRRANLRGADLGGAHGLRPEALDGAATDAATVLPKPGPPPDFDMKIVLERLLSRKRVDSAWIPFIHDLDLAATGIRTLARLSGLTALTSLNLRSTGVSDVGPLSGLTALTSLNLWGTRVSDTTPLRHLRGLKISGFK